MKAQKFIPLLVVAAGLLAYHNSFSGPFIFDDIASIAENPTIYQLWPISEPLSPLPMGGATVEGRPLINLSLAINYAFGGLEVWGYHALNLAIHILAGLTLFGVVRRTLLQPRLRERFGAAANELALATAVIWTVHPLQTESVTYVIQRAESLMGLFYLLTLYCLIRAVESPRPRPWYDLCVVACALGMASKEVMASAPLIVMLYDRAFVSGSFREAWRRRWALYLALAGTWILLGCLVFFTECFSAAVAIARLLGITWWAYLLTEPGVILHYLRLAVWPHPLCFDYYGWPFARTWMSILPPSLVMAILLGATAWAWKANSTWGILGAWFFLILAPSSSFIPTDSPAYEHRMYLPLAAVVVPVVMKIYARLGRRSLVVFLAVAVGLGFLTARRNEDYRSELSIWVDTIMKRPQNPRAHDSLGRALWHVVKLEDASGREDAIGHYEQALLVEPDSVEAHNNLAVALVRLGRMQEAMGHWEQALRIKPDSAKVRYNMGVALQRAGKVSEAIAQYEQALRIKPDYPQAQNNLARLMATLTPAEGGDPARAVTLSERACELTNNRVAAYLDTLAAAYAAAGRFNDAVATAQKAIELARSAGQPEVAKQIEPRLQLYRNEQAYRQTVAVTSPPKP